VSAPRSRRSTGRVLVLVLSCLALVAGLSGAGGTSAPARAADLAQFRPGNIIGDAVFFNPGTMSAGDVQAFLATKGSRCSVGADGSPCLKDYRQDTWTRPADARCPGTYVGAPAQLASEIIHGVARACSVNPQVLLVLLQKEQGLVTTTGASATAVKYRKATGYGCPDTAPCDAQYNGFYNQVYMAAWRYQDYADRPTSFNHRAGRVSTVYFHPDLARCGSTQVLIENQATAGLYNYTPYQPNAAALAAGYGTGDSCSAYGNRNFYSYFTDWFGSTQYPVTGGIFEAWQAAGAQGSVLGHPVRPAVCGLAQGGCAQDFRGGSIFWHPATGGRIVYGGILERWNAAGRETGTLRYPVRDAVCGIAQGGCAQDFQGGSIFWSPSTGARALSGGILAEWNTTGRETGSLGYPVGDQVCGLVQGGCSQEFQEGSISWSPATGAHVVTDAVLTAWTARGAGASSVGYPVGDTVCGLAQAGCGQDFQKGAIFWTPSTGARAVTGAVLSRWTASGRETGSLGYPLGDTVCGLVQGGCGQDFQEGSLFWTGATGARTVTGTVLTAWNASGREAGSLGYPTGNTVCGIAQGGCAQDFQKGSVFWTSATGARTISGAVLAKWNATGRETGSLGYPTGSTVCRIAQGGCGQDFQKGSIFWTTATGARTITGAVLTTWNATGREGGSLGYPTGDTVCGIAQGGCGQDFQKGSVFWTTATGARSITGAVLTTWNATGRESGALRYPVGNAACTTNGPGCTQDFQRGTIAWTSTTGAHTVTGGILERWNTTGREAGVLGHPLVNAVCGIAQGGCGQDFQRGSIFWTPATGAHSITGELLTKWNATGRETGALGYPTAEATATGSGQQQTFQRGVLTTG